MASKYGYEECSMGRENEERVLKYFSSEGEF